VIRKWLPARVERRLAAILAADIAGYSRLMSADEVGTLAALKAHRARDRLGKPGDGIALAPQMNRGSISDSLRSSGHASPLIASECEHL
jgi:hypothetical protein